MDIIGLPLHAISMARTPSAKSSGPALRHKWGCSAKYLAKDRAAWGHLARSASDNPHHRAAPGAPSQTA
eukprot:1325274-Lingulodinium_polyedra.AAC.1